MTSPTGTPLDKSALRLLSMLADTTGRPLSADERFAGDEAALIAADLACKRENAAIEITAAGRAYLARLAAARSGHAVDPFRAQHLDIVVRSAKGPDGQATLAIDESESPLAWLARRTGRDGRALIEAHQLQACARISRGRRSCRARHPTGRRRSRATVVPEARACNSRKPQSRRGNACVARSMRSGRNSPVCSSTSAVF
jgi:hypothetical protein